MSSPANSADKIRFGDYELDIGTSELQTNGNKFLLQGQPFQILCTLLQRPGELVTREELKRKLWSEGTLVDFDHSLNKAVNRLREVLADSAEEPKFIETIPRRGYRFIGSVGQTHHHTRSDDAVNPDVQQTERSMFRRFFLFFGATPYRRWEIMQLRMLIWCVLLACLGWRFMNYAPQRWEYLLFLVQLACVALVSIFISFLVYTGALNRYALQAAVHRTAPWVRWSTVAMVVVTVAMGVVIASSHPILAGLLVLCSVAGGLKYTIFKAAIDRSAFPEQPFGDLERQVGFLDR